MLFLNGKESIYLSDPIERGRIAAVQTVPGLFFDKFSHCFTRCRKMTDLDRKLMEDLEPWFIHIEIPDSHFKDTLNDNLEIICNYLRGVMSGVDTVYKIPEDRDELTKERLIRV